MSNDKNVWLGFQMLHDIFGKMGLKITANQIVNFLDITLDLENAKFAPYRKPNNQPLYVDSRSNHPPSILKQIPISINNSLPFHLTKNPSMNANLSTKAHLNTAITMFLWNIQPTALHLHHLRNEGAKETLSGSTPPPPRSANPLKPTSRGISYTFSINTSHLQVVSTKYSTATQLKLATAACLM